MNLPVMKFLRCAGKAVLPKIPKWLAKAMGLEIVADMYEVGEHFCQNWRKESSDAQARAELQAVAMPLPPAQLNEIVREVVAEVAGNQPIEVQIGLTQYLLQIPSATRQALRTPADPTGTTVPPTFSLKKPDDVIGLLPFGLAQFQAGERPACLHGDWELLELLGRGGQGEVWKACRTDDAEFVAAFKFCTDPDAKRQLQLGHEKAIVQRVKKANLKGVVTLEDYKLDSSPPWLRYELVEGGDLTGLVHEWNENPDIQRTPFVLSIVQRLAKTVGQFHRLPEPVIHRDLKPANILVRRVLGDKITYTFLIADFGIGHVTAGRSLDQAKVPTPMAQSLGTLRYACTPLYASPQQRSGADPDPRDDVYALGVIWYQLLLRDLSRGAPTGLGWDKKLRALGLAAEHIQLLGECLAEDADDRPKDAQHLYEQLTALKPAGERSEPAGSPPKPAPSPAPKPISETQGQRVRRLRAEAAQKHEDVAALLQLHDYEAAAQMLEAFSPEQAAFRDEGVFRDVIIRRDQARLLQQKINDLYDAHAFNDPRLPNLIAEYLRIKPNDSDMRELAKEFPTPKPGQLWINSLDMKFAWVPPGRFWMGGSGGQAGDKQVDIAQAFYLGIYPVTQEQWQCIMGNNPSHFSGADLPVEQVSWDDAQEFIKKMNAQEQDAGWLYRLPTDAEWEYACRGAASSKEECSFDFYFDKPTNDLSSEQANFDGNYPAGRGAKGKYLERTTKVGSYRPNRLGIYDMHGNVWEWCDDLYEGGPARVLRGGSWGNFAEVCRAADRCRFTPSNRDYYLGFRLARVPSSGK